MNAHRYGATPEEWEFWSRLAPTDLLPVVSNPKATISPHSTLGTLGKVPSQYANDGLVVGMRGWPDHFCTPAQVQVWSRNPDLGICLITRRFRAIDIDVEDPELADKVEVAIVNTLGFPLPCRYRENSGKRLLLFAQAGKSGKRTCSVNGGIVERLGTGQQCIVAGTHRSGSRYLWRDSIDQIAGGWV